MYADLKIITLELPTIKEALKLLLKIEKLYDTIQSIQAFIYIFKSLNLI